MAGKSATEFLDGLIEKESCLIERLFLQHEMDQHKQSSWTILKINAYRFFQFSKVTCSDKSGWSGCLWYSPRLLGGQIYELRRRGISDQEIYDCIIKAREFFFIQERGKYNNHKIYDAMISGMRDKLKSL